MKKWLPHIFWYFQYDKVVFYLSSILLSRVENSILRKPFSETGGGFFGKKY